jgi:hypothetical protein
MYVSLLAARTKSQSHQAGYGVFRLHFAKACDNAAISWLLDSTFFLPGNGQPNEALAGWMARQHCGLCMQPAET